MQVWQGCGVRGARQAWGSGQARVPDGLPETAGWVGGRHPLTPNHRPPASMGTGREKQEAQTAGAGWWGQTPSGTAEGSSACTACRLTPVLGQGASEGPPPRPPAPAPAPCFLSEPRLLPVPRAPSSERQPVLSCPKPPGPGAVQREPRPEGGKRSRCSQWLHWTQAVGRPGARVTVRCVHTVFLGDVPQRPLLLRPCVCPGTHQWPRAHVHT